MKTALISLLLIVFGLSSYAQHWEEVNGGIHGVFEDIGTDVYAMASDSIHHLLYVGGTFDSAGDVTSKNLTFWDGTRWISSEAQFNYMGYVNPVNTIILFHDTIFSAGASGVGQWFDTTILLHQTPPLAGITSFAIFRDSLYATTNVAVYKYTHTSWENIGTLEYDEQPTEGHALAVYQDQLVVGGLFRGVGKLHCNNIAAWDGKKWSTLGSGTKWSESKYLGTVTALAVYQDNLYAAGYFDTAGGIFCPRIAQWNGAVWDSLRSRDTSFCGDVFCMMAHDSLLYLGGDFVPVGEGCIGDKIMTWNGKDWKDLKLDVNLVVYTMAFFDNQLYAAGHFSILNDTTVHNIVRYVNQPAVCTSPYKGKAEEITATGATLQWKDSSNAVTGYRIYYKVKNTNGWQKAHSKTESKTIKGLSPNTTYTWMIGTKCDTTHSGFSKHYEFTTLSEKESMRQASGFDFLINPNPGNDQIAITISSQSNTAILIKVFDISGKEVYSNKWFNEEAGISKSLDLTRLPDGIYTMQIISGNQEATKKLVLMK